MNCGSLLVLNNGTCSQFLLRHVSPCSGLPDWPFCGQINLIKWPILVFGNHSLLWPKTTIFERSQWPELLDLPFCGQINLTMWLFKALGVAFGHKELWPYLATNSLYMTQATKLSFLKSCRDNVVTVEYNSYSPPHVATSINKYLLCDISNVVATDYN